MDSAPLAAHSSARGWGLLLIVVVGIVWGASPVVGYRTSLTALTALSLIGAIVGLFDPPIGLLAAGVQCTLDPVSRVFLLSGGLLRWNTFNYLLLLVIVVRLPLLLRLGGWSLRLLGALALVLLVELPFSGNIMSGTQHTLTLVSAFGLTAYALRVVGDDESWYWLGAVNGVVACLGCLFYYIFRSSLPSINPNSLSYMPLTALFCLTLAFPFARSGPRALAIVLLFAANGAWVLLSGSRGALLNAAWCMLFLVGITPGVAKRFLLLAAAGLAVVVLGARFADLGANVEHRLDKTFDSQQSLMSRTSGRSTLVLGGWYLFLEHPLGVGTGGFATSWADLGTHGGQIAWSHMTGHEREAHSAWIKTLAENGLPGLLLLLAYVLSHAIIGLRSGDPMRRAFGGLVTWTLAIAFLSTEFQAKGLWLLASGVLALTHERDDRVIEGLP